MAAYVLTQAGAKVARIASTPILWVSPKISDGVILDEIAYPEHADEKSSHGVAFFTFFRDLTASGFWTTEEGMKDLQYMGNTYVQVWTGAPEEEIERPDLPRAPWDVI